MDSVYVVMCYDEIAGIYTTQSAAEERVQEISLIWGVDSPSLYWQHITLNQRVQTLYDRRGER